MVVVGYISAFVVVYEVDRFDGGWERWLGRRC